MAGSGFPPLPNIPYCCLPQESGPCLSTSVGDRPLRSPSHRRLGGPSPRQPSNGTHARPPPRRRFPAAGMPPPRRIGYHPPFPGAVPTGRVGCIRVTHPSATLKAPEGASPVRLACIRPAASVHPEPGSNSSLYYCLSSLFSVSGSAFARGRIPATAGLLGSLSGPAASGGRTLLCWPQTFKELANLSPLSSPPLRLRVQKYYLFPSPQ